jgi:hypothetical protein
MYLKYIFCLPIGLFLFGCGSFTAIYDMSLQSVERPKQASAQYGEIKITPIKENDTAKYQFEDSLINSTWLPTPQGIYFTIRNKTDHSIKIKWDDAAYIDPSGASKRVMHSGIKYLDRNNSQAPSIIARKSKIDDFVFPTDNVEWLESVPSWFEKPLFPVSFNNTTGDTSGLAKIREQVNINAGKTFQVLMPLEIENVTNEYIFTFKINSVTVK